MLTTSGEARHLGVWKTVDGAFVHALRTREESSHPELGDPIWTPGGRYLLAPTREGSSGPSVVGIWDVQAGRYRGSLAGCTELGTPAVAFSLVGSRFRKRCSIGDVLAWDLDTVLTGLKAFWAELSR